MFFINNTVTTEVYLDENSGGICSCKEWVVSVMAFDFDVSGLLWLLGRDSQRQLLVCATKP